MFVENYDGGKGLKVKPLVSKFSSQNYIVMLIILEHLMMVFQILIAEIIDDKTKYVIEGERDRATLLDLFFLNQKIGVKENVLNVTDKEEDRLTREIVQEAAKDEAEIAKMTTREKIHYEYQ